MSPPAQTKAKRALPHPGLSASLLWLATVSVILILGSVDLPF